ncbi:MAG: FG-GAP-like repeat-containing protein [Lysobacterales bacterium]
MLLRDRSAVAAGQPLSRPRGKVPLGLLALISLLALLGSSVALAQATCTWNLNSSGLWDNPANWNGCTGGNGTPAGTPGPADHAIISQATPAAVVDLGASNRIVSQLTLASGTLDGSVDLNVTSQFDWSGGDLSATPASGAALTLDAGANGLIDGTLHQILERRLRNLGTLTWSGGDILVSSNAVIDNQSIFNIDAGIIVIRTVNGGGPPLRMTGNLTGGQFINAATPGAQIEKLGAGEAEIGAGLDFDNQNNVLVSTGALRVAAPGLDVGTYQIAAGARLDLAPGLSDSRSLAGLPAVSGTGVLRKVDEGSIDIDGAFPFGGRTEVLDGMLSFNTQAPSVSFAQLQVQAPGVLSGSNDFSVSGSLQWTGGEIRGAGGSLTLLGAATATVTLDNAHPSAYLTSRNLINQGSWLISASGTDLTHFWLDSADIDNQSNLELRNNSAQNLQLACVSQDCGSFQNQPGATLTLNDISGVISIQSDLAAFHNAGLVDLIEGCAGIDPPGTDTGTYRYGGSCTLAFFTRMGSERIFEPTVVLNPQGGTALQVEGRLRINGVARSFQNLLIQPDATLYGPAAINLDGNTLWRGTIEGAGLSETVSIGSIGTVQVGSEPTDTPTLRNRLLSNDGALNIQASVLLLDADPQINNNSTLTLAASPQLGAGIGCSAPPVCGSLVNLGLITTFSAGPGVGPPVFLAPELTLSQQGQVEATSGALLLDAVYTAFPGSTLRVLTTAIIDRSSGPLALAAGTLTGDGIVRADVQVDAVDVAPGSGPGGLTINGSFSATSNTTYSMEIGGIVPPARRNQSNEKMPPAQYDRLTISGPAALAGIVNIIDIGYTPSASDSFVLLSYPSFSGGLGLGSNPYSGFLLDAGATRTRLTQNLFSVCEWNPGGAGADDWTNPAKWNNCSLGVGPGPGPAGTPGAVDRALIAGGSVNLDVPVLVDALELTGGTVSGSNNLTVNGEFIWTGGFAVGPGGSELILDSASIGQLSGGQKVLDGRTLRIGGATTWTTGLIELANAAVITIDASGGLISRPSAAPEQIFGSGSGTAQVVNDGAIVKEGFNISGIAENVEYVGTGAVIVDQGEFFISAASPSPFDGSFVSNLGTLRFNGASRSFSPSASLGGAGLIAFGDAGPMPAINQVDACLSSPANVRVENAEVAFNCASPTALDYLNLAHPGSVVEGSSAITIIGQLEWNHGIIRGTAPGQTIEVAVGASASLAYLVNPAIGRFLNNRQFINHGLLFWVGENPLTLEAGAELRNESDGLLRVLLQQGLGTHLFWDSSVGARLLNLGSMEIDAAEPFSIEAPFDQAGTVTINGGAMTIRQGGADSGDYVIGTDARLDFQSASSIRNLSTSSSVSGPGKLIVSNSASVLIDNVPFAPGAVEIRNLGTLQIDAPAQVAIGDWFLAGGILNGNADLAASNTMVWAAGTLASTLPGTAAFTILPGADLQIIGLQPMRVGNGVSAPLGSLFNQFLDHRELRVQGTANWSGGDFFVPLNSTGRVVVEAGASFGLSSPDMPFFGCAGIPCVAEFIVDGTLQMFGSTADLQLTSPMLLGGDLFVDSGALGLPDLVQNAGVIRVGAGANLNLGTLTINGGSLQGSGIVGGDVTNLGGSIDPGLSPGYLSIIGDFVQGAGGTLEIQIAGLTPGVNADFLFVSGTATLDGTVNISDAGFTPTPPQIYEFLNSDTVIVGAFANANVAYPGYEVSYDPNNAILSPVAGPLTVNSIADPGTGTCDVTECTLREAIDQANSTPGPDIIQFAIPGGSCVGAGGACVIVPSTPLPQITDSLIIDGYSQPGAAPNTNLPSSGLGSNAVLQIEIDGNLTSAASGLVINAPSSTVTLAGLAIHSFLGNVVTLGPGDASYDLIGNFIGLRADGTAPALTPGTGVSIQGGSTFVGDSTAAGMNVISGNQQQGIAISNIPLLAPAVVRGNLIGTDPTGLLPRPNGLQGIIATTPSRLQGIVIGGNLPDDRNVISGNAQDGIRFDCSATGDICFDGARVVGNFIGPAADATPMGNGGHGVNLASMIDGRVYIGGPLPGAGNLIAFNGGNGITATFGGTGRGTFQRNEILGNTGIAIDLGADGRTANDANDPDLGPNGFLNFPYFTGYVLAGTGDSADFDLLLDTPDVSGNYPAEVDLYLAIEDEPGVYLGSMNCLVPNSPCSATVTFPAGVILTPDDVVLGVVVDGFGKTSEASFYATSAAIVGDNPDPSDIGTPYDVDVEITSTDPFAPVGDVAVADGVGNMCTATLSKSTSGVATGTCQLPTTGPAGAVLTLTADYVAAPAPFTDSSTSDAHTVNALPQPPVISLISPAAGPATGGTTVTITGSNFVVGATSFDFGTDPGLGVNCVSTSLCTVNAPAGTGIVDIRATTSAGRSVNTRVDDFSYRAGAPLLCTNLVSVGTFPAGISPYAMASGDFNGDGLKDVAAANNDASGTVSVLLGTGAGGFAPATSFAVDPFPRSVAVGDFNGDDVTDLAVANYGATTVSILIGTGTGGFAPANNIVAGSGPHAVAVGDFNGDGKADLAVALLDADSLAILLGDGVGGFGPPATVPSLRSTSLGISDFDQDGNSDIALGNQLMGDAAVVLGTGTGSFGVPAEVPVGSNPTALAVGDFDGDGFSDLAVANRGSNDVSVLIAGSGGAFTVATSYPVGSQPVSIDIGDFDGDGLADLAVANFGSNDVSLLPGTGSGSFGTAINVPVGTFPSSVLVGDFDASGQPYLLVAVDFANIVSLRNAGCPPTITALTPTGGPETGGTVVTIDGSDFVIGATSFSFGPNPATAVSCSSTLQCTATSPAGSGVVDVIATTVAGASTNTSSDDFSYAAATSTTILSIDPEPSVVGQPYTVIADVTQGGIPVVSGSVLIQQLSDGSTCSYSLKTGGGCQLVSNSAITTAVRAFYSGAGGLSPSVSPIVTHVVNRAPTEILISSDTPDPSTVGQEIAVTVEVAALAPGAGTPTGQILVTDGSASCGFTLPTLSCSFVPKALGAATLEARYLGDANFAPSTDTEAHTVTVNGADLSIIKRNGLRILPAGQPSTYVLLVSNAGPDNVQGARVTDILPPQLSNASWTCTGTGGAVCPASGTGTVDALVNLPSGSSLTFLLTVTAQASPEQIVTNRATVTPPSNSTDPVLGNNESSDTDPIGLFGDGLEDEND